MTNGLVQVVGLCALNLLCVGCSSEQRAEVEPTPADRPTAGSGNVSAPSGGGEAGANVAGASGGNTASAGGESGSLPTVGGGPSVYALECHGDSRDCAGATVPCFAVASPPAGVAAGWACANRCTSKSDCSDAPSGAEAQASCVPFASASHCVLVCRNENSAFACPGGMTCYV